MGVDRPVGCHLDHVAEQTQGLGVIDYGGRRSAGGHQFLGQMVERAHHNGAGALPQQHLESSL